MRQLLATSQLPTPLQPCRAWSSGEIVLQAAARCLLGQAFSAGSTEVLDLFERIPAGSICGNRGLDAKQRPHVYLGGAASLK